MNKTAYATLIACLSTAMLLAACKPAEAPAPAPATEAVEVASAAAAPVVGADYPMARDACLAEVARQTGVAQEKLVATEVLWAEAGVGVTVQVPDADAPWSCLSDEKGKVQGAAYTGSEGKL